MSLFRDIPQPSSSKPNKAARDCGCQPKLCINLAATLDSLFTQVDVAASGRGRVGMGFVDSTGTSKVSHPRGAIAQACDRDRLQQLALQIQASPHGLQSKCPLPHHRCLWSCSRRCLSEPVQGFRDPLGLIFPICNISRRKHANNLLAALVLSKAGQQAITSAHKLAADFVVKLHVLLVEAFSDPRTGKIGNSCPF